MQSIQTVLTSSELLSAVIALAVAVIGFMTAKLRVAMKKLQDGVDATRVSSHNAATNAEAAREQVVNDHKTNLRDDFDDLVMIVRDGFARMDHQFGEFHERQMQESRDRSALAERLTSMDNRLSGEIRSLRESPR